MRERQQLDGALAGFTRLVRELDDNIELVSLGEDEGDESVVTEAESALKKLRAEAHKREVEALLSGEADSNDSYVEIHAGAGGTESQDWALMLERMYIRWAEGRDYKVEIIGEHPGEEAGVKSATILVKGANAYGWLKTESACTGSCASPPSIPMPGGTRVSPRCRSIQPSTTPSPSTSTRRMCASIPTARAAPAASM